MTTTTLNHYRAICEARGFEWAEYADCDEWTLSMIFDDVESDDEEGEDY